MTVCRPVSDAGRGGGFHCQPAPLGALANYEQQPAGKQPEEDGDGRQQEGGTMSDMQLERWAASQLAVVGPLLQSLQDLDPKQVHEQDQQQAHTTTELQSPAHIKEPVTGQGAGADSNKPPSSDRRQAHHQEDAPESPENNSWVSFVRLQGQTPPIHQSAGRKWEEEGGLAALG